MNVLTVEIHPIDNIFSKLFEKTMLKKYLKLYLKERLNRYSYEYISIKLLNNY